MIKKLFSVILIICICFSVFGLTVSAFTPTSFDVRAESATLISLDTGETLYEKDVDTKRYPASLTKIMTAILFLENVNDLDGEIITVSDNAVTSLLGTDSSVGGLKIGEQFTARNLLYLLLMSSANDAAVAISEYVSGSESAFVQLMNEKAAELKMNNTHFVNPHGLYNENHYTTVRDISKLARYAMKNSVFAEVVSTARYKLPATNMSAERTLSTTNYLIDPSVPQYFYKYAEGVKTGYTDEAGRCFVGAAKKDGYSYLCVLMKSPAYNDKKQYVRFEFDDAQKLLDWAFTDFSYKTVLKKGETVGEAKVNLAWNTDFVTVTAKDEVSSVLPKNADLSTVTYKLDLNKKSFDAAIEKGQKLGTVSVVYAGETLGTVDAVAAVSIKRNAFLYAGRIIKDIITSTAMKIIFGLIIAAVIVFLIACKWLNRNRKQRNKIKRKRRPDDVIRRSEKEDR